MAQSRTEERAEVTIVAYLQSAGGAAYRLRASPHPLGPSETACAADICGGRSWVPHIATRHASARRHERREALQPPGPWGDFGAPPTRAGAPTRAEALRRAPYKACCGGLG